jgi:hypothetical protein
MIRINYSIVIGFGISLVSGQREQKGSFMFGNTSAISISVFEPETFSSYPNLFSERCMVLPKGSHKVYSNSGQNTSFSKLDISSQTVLVDLIDNNYHIKTSIGTSYLKIRGD